MRRFVLAAALLALLSVAGCGGGDGSDTTAGGTATSGGGQTLDVAASDFLFEPADLQAQPGELTINLTNDGEAPHAIEIEGNGVEEGSDTIDPGDSTSLTLDLEEGTYEIYCPVDGHREQGMVGTLTVGAGGGAATGSTDTGDDDGASTGDDSDDSGSGTGTGGDDDSRY